MERGESLVHAKPEDGILFPADRDYHPDYDCCQVKLWKGLLADFGFEIKVLRVSSTVITVLE